MDGWIESESAFLSLRHRVQRNGTDIEKKKTMTNRRIHNAGRMRDGWPSQPYSWCHPRNRCHIPSLTPSIHPSTISYVVYALTFVLVDPPPPPGPSLSDRAKQPQIQVIPPLSPLLWLNQCTAPLWQASTCTLLTHTHTHTRVLTQRRVWYWPADKA